MSGLKGVIITRGSLGAKVVANEDAISALLVNGVAVAADSANGIIGIALGETVKLNSVKDAKSYGIDQNYDTTNNVRVFRHISEFFRKSSEGYTLYLMLYSGTPEDALGDTYAKKMIAHSNGSIRMLALAYNPPVNYTPVMINGLEENVYNAISAAQEFYDWTFSSFRPCQIIIEGRGFGAVNATAALDLRNIVITGGVLSAYKVSMCIAQDYTYADNLDAIGKKFADVGTMLGCLAAKGVNLNIAEVEGGDISNPQKGYWTKAGLSNHQTIEDFEEELDSLDDKGYVFAIKYTGRTGVYWNNDHTCTPIIQDEDGFFNEYTISYGRAHDKAVRNLRTVLLPKVKSTQPVDRTTGKLPSAIVTSFEKLGDTVFNKMEGAGEISTGKTYIDANSNLTIIPRILNVSFVFVPTGQIDEIRGTIKIKTSI
ncbi:MAG: hypothetical protein H6Q15_1761 [Bacteroidetes bacterium]|nr:hypothetical protein [Bacteroidota bacterium]